MDSRFFGVAVGTNLSTTIKNVLRNSRTILSVTSDVPITRSQQAPSNLFDFADPQVYETSVVFGIIDTPVEALIPGLTILQSQVACCGIAGTYGYKKEKYQISQSVGDPLFEFIKNVNAPLAVCDSETCRWQITHGTGLPAVHPVELVASSLGHMPEGELGSIIHSLQSNFE